MEVWQPKISWNFTNNNHQVDKERKWKYVHTIIHNYNPPHKHSQVHIKICTQFSWFFTVFFDFFQFLHFLSNPAFFDDTVFYQSSPGDIEVISKSLHYTTIQQVSLTKFVLSNIEVTSRSSCYTILVIYMISLGIKYWAYMFKELINRLWIQNTFFLRIYL